MMEYLGWTISEGRYTGRGWQYEYVITDPDGKKWTEGLGFTDKCYAYARPWRLKRVLRSEVKHLNKIYLRQKLKVNLDG